MRSLMIACDLLSALLYGSLPVLSLIRVLSAPVLVVVALLAGTVNVLFSTAYQGLLPALVTGGDLAEGNARLQGSAQVAAIAGRSMAGLAAEAVGAATALLFNAASFLVSAACLQCIHVARRPAAPRRSTSVRAETLKGIRFVVTDPYLRPLVLSASVGNLAYTGNLALVIVFLVRVIGLSPATVGFLIATTGIGGVLGAMVAGWLTRTLGSARALVAATLFSGFSGLLIPLTGPGPRMACYVIGSATVAAGITIANIIVASFRQAYCPPSMLGRVTTSMRFPVYGAVPFGAVLAGALGTALGTRNGLWAVLAIFAASGTLLLTRAICSVRDLPGRPITQPAAEDHLPVAARDEGSNP